MQTFRKKIRENPLLGSLIILVLCFACNELVPNVGYLLPDNIVGDYMYEVICMLWPIGLVYVCGYMDIFSKRGLRRTFMAGLPLFLVYGGYLTTSIWKAVFDPKMPLLPAEQIILSIITLIGIGIREEAIYRGIIVNLYEGKRFNSHKGLLYTAISSSFFFGAIHFGNLLAGVRLESTLVQVLVAWAMGMVNCAIYLRGGSIWGMMILHAMIDGSSLFDGFFYQSATVAAEAASSGAIESVNSLGLLNLIPIVWCIPLALFLLRKKKTQEIIARRQTENAAQMNTTAEE